jgi:hypothetical protein
LGLEGGIFVGTSGLFVLVLAGNLSCRHAGTQKSLFGLVFVFCLFFVSFVSFVSFRHRQNLEDPEAPLIRKLLFWSVFCVCVGSGAS